MTFKTIRLRIKALPGASRDSIRGVYGNQLKINIAAPPEDGKANKAICKTLAKALDIKAAEIILVSGQSSRDKVFEIQQYSAKKLSTQLGLNPDETRLVLLNPDHHTST